jgi:hypothetical protein
LVVLIGDDSVPIDLFLVSDIISQSGNPRSHPRGNIIYSFTLCRVPRHSLILFVYWHIYKGEDTIDIGHRQRGMASYSHPPTSLRPQNISNRPDPTDTIYIETASIMAPPAQAQPGPGTGSGQPNPDLAGVLRRNQACLNCRRRKLVRVST